MNILINTLGISDSGGITVFDKLLNEFCHNSSNQYFIVCNKNINIDKLQIKYQSSNSLRFIVIPSKGILYRLYYENYIIRRLVKNNNIKLIYNFSGTYQIFMKIPQIVKIQNLLFFSEKLDLIYKQRKQLNFWIKQIFLKRIVFKLMLNGSTYIEVQSDHVKGCLSNFINANNKVFYVKSDINVSDHEFSLPKKYDFSKKIKFLYIVGPHFEYLHKNLIDFTVAMLDLNEKGINFEINITLTSDQLNNSKIWEMSLNSRTNFIGYISDQEKMTELFCDNTILISTSIIETLGLHVIDGIKNGVITIVPDEDYSSSVYGENMFKYELFNKNSLLSTIMGVINYKGLYSEKILSLQGDLKQSEMSKFDSVLDVFDEVINIQQ